MNPKEYIIVPANGNVDGSFSRVLVELVHEEAGQIIVRFLSVSSPWKVGELYFLRCSQWQLQEPSEKLAALIKESNKE